MKHPNRIKSNIASKFQFISYESVLCLLICVFSFFGLKALLSNSNADFTSVYTPTSAFSNDPSEIIDRDLKKVDAIPFESNTPTDNLEISGYFEANENMNFIIKDFHAYVDYELDFGNGIRIKAEEFIVKYAYPKAGKYNVRLWASSQGKKKLLHKERINVQQAIEVSPDAYFEQ